tara:strand:+ start:36 stop:1277 length:1242 start_codon:yes stop_codon:yes gene_type:complete
MDVMTENKVVPKLRFGEFKDDWNNHLLDDIATFLKGKGISKSELDDDGKTECIRYGELYVYYNELIDEVKSKTNLENLVLSKANDVIIPASGETQLDIATASCVLRSGIALGGDLNVIRTENNGLFLSYYLNSKKKFEIARLSQGSSVVHLYASQLKTLKLNLPILPEQQKIASFLSAVDKKLQQLIKKKELLEEYKKGVMQQIFSQELRFKDDNGNSYPNWEEKKLGEFIEVCSSKRVLQEHWKSSGVPFLRTREIKNLSEKVKFKTPIFISELLFEELKEKYGVPNVGDILATGVGTIGELYIVKENDKFYFKDGNVLWFKMNNQLNSIYLAQLFKTKFIRKQLSDNASITTVATFTIDGARKTKIVYPCVDEQKKIANFLSSLDSKVDLLSTQIENTKSFKKGLLQQMFV